MYLSVCVKCECVWCTVHIYAHGDFLCSTMCLHTHMKKTWLQLVKQGSKILPTNVYALSRNMQAWQL